MDIIQTLAAELGRNPRHIESVITLLDEGNTIPFIARYRKELHGSMDDTVLRTLETRLQYLRGMEERRQTIAKAIEAQGKLSEERRALRSDLGKAQAQNRKLNSDLNASKRDLEKMKSKLAENDLILAGYRKALNLVGPDLPKPWLDGSKEARAHVIGHVIKVDTDYGYVAVDLGTSTRVKQPIGDKFLDVDPRIAPKNELVVARGDLAAGNAEFIARIELDKVGTECSTADLPAAAAQKIQVGDIVYIESAK